MAHYAHIVNNVVDRVIVAESDFIATLADPENWILTSYNTRGGVHVDPVTREPDGGIPVHKNFAGIGHSWDGTGFFTAQPYPSWTFNPSTYQWDAPIAPPNDGNFYGWDEESTSWKVRIKS